MQTIDVIKLVLLAMLAGIAIPLAVQLVLALRAAQRAFEVATRLERTLGQLGEGIDRLRRPDGSAPALSPVATALVAAGAAAIRALVSSPPTAAAVARDPGDDAPATTLNGGRP